MIRLVPLPENQLTSWLSSMWAQYREQLLGAGFSSHEASLSVQRNQAALFDNGVPNENQRIFQVLDDDTKVGILWLSSRGEPRAREWYVYDIEIDAPYRGQGHGRSTMLAAEDYVKSQSGTRLALNVFGPNAVARGLYESLGYKVMALEMRKDLD